MDSNRNNQEKPLWTIDIVTILQGIFFLTLQKEWLKIHGGWFRPQNEERLLNSKEEAVETNPMLAFMSKRDQGNQGYRTSL